MRAEDIIAQAYKYKSEFEAQGKKPERIVMTRAQYELVQAWHQRLGELPPGMQDYISRYELFGIPIFIQDSTPDSAPGR
jgi:hypothetical protein